MGYYNSVHFWLNNGAKYQFTFKSVQNRKNLPKLTLNDKYSNWNQAKIKTKTICMLYMMQFEDLMAMQIYETQWYSVKTFYE